MNKVKLPYMKRMVRRIKGPPKQSQIERKRSYRYGEYAMDDKTTNEFNYRFK